MAKHFSRAGKSNWLRSEKLFYLINFTFTFGERCRVGFVTGDKKITLGCRLSERDFEHICEETLDSLNDAFEDLAESDLTPEDYDVLFAVSYLLQGILHLLCQALVNFTFTMSGTSKFYIYYVRH